jgi:hypothetical protein
MKRTHGAEPIMTNAQQAINAIAVTVGGIYLATHSVIVTVVAMIASTLLTAWALWLARRRDQLPAGDAQESETIRARRTDTPQWTADTTTPV